MGFRSTLITDDSALRVPKWFTDKHTYLVPIGRLAEGDTEPRLPIASTAEAKYYSDFASDERFLDLQRICREQTQFSFDVDIEIILLHECGGITKVIVSKDSIMANEPTRWKNVDGVEHHYCYGCSKPD